MDAPVFELDWETGLLGGNPCLCSPNCDDRPQGVSIDTLVIHAISLPPGYFDTGMSFICIPPGSMVTYRLIVYIIAFLIAGVALSRGN